MGETDTDFLSRMMEFFAVPQGQRQIPDMTRLLALAAEAVRLREALDLYREAVRIDATMEGPKFAGSNASALKRAWDFDCALSQKESTP